MVLQDGYFDKYCKGCNKQYTVMKYKWCKLCQSSGNKQIDDFIEEKAENQSILDIKFELIPYNQFYNITEISRNDFTKICLTIWKNGHRYEKAILKYLYNSQNRTEEFLNEV